MEIVPKEVVKEMEKLKKVPKAVMEEIEKLRPHLRTEYGAKCYRDNSPTDCHYLAHFMLSVKDSEKAATLFKTTCDEHKYAESCHKYADLFRSTKLNRGQSLSMDDQIVIFNYYRKGCQFGQAKSCTPTFYTLCSYFHARMSVLDEENPDLLALKMLERGCDLGSSESCYLAGGAHLVGIPGVLDKNVSATYKYDVKACQLGNKLACNTLSGALPNGNPTSNSKSNAFQIRVMQLENMRKREEERLKRSRPRPQKK